MELNPPKVMLERSLYLLWLAITMVAIGLFMLSLVHLMVFAIEGVLPNVFAYLQWLALPLVMKLKLVGVRYAHFQQHEDAFNGMFDLPDSPLSDQLARHISAINSASGWNRQALRMDAKEWLKANYLSLSREDKQRVSRELGYLFTPSEALPEVQPGVCQSTI